MRATRDYRGRSVVITGAAGGLGQALASVFAAEGGRIVAIDLAQQPVLALAQALREQGGEALGIGCDLTSQAACDDAIAQARAAYGGIDLLINNAGISARCLLQDTSPGLIERVMAVNFFGAVSCTTAALDSLRERRGQIVTISSVAGFSPLVGRTAYAASKHALHGFFDSLRSELKADGVDVMLVCPSFIATGIEAAALGGHGQTAGAPRQTAGAEATPAQVAAHILAAARRNQRLCLPSTTSRLAWWVSRLAPAIYERLMLRRVGGEFDLSQRSPS